MRGVSPRRDVANITTYMPLKRDHQIPVMKQQHDKNAHELIPPLPPYTLLVNSSHVYCRPNLHTNFNNKVGGKSNHFFVRDQLVSARQRIWEIRSASTLRVYIVACQRGGVSNEPPGQRQDTGPGILKSTNRIPDSPYFYYKGPVIIYDQGGAESKVRGRQKKIFSPRVEWAPKIHSVSPRTKLILGFPEKKLSMKFRTTLPPR